jgi:hypothetical protein
VLKRLRFATKAIGPDTLGGFTEDQIGLHSARSGAAMAMYLAGVPLFTIMLLGRWSSDAFLRYIRKQVKEFSIGISQKMILHEDFFTVPLSSTGVSNSSNRPSKSDTQNNYGLDFKVAIRPLISSFT